MVEPADPPPALVLDYLRALSADLRAGAILARDGALLAGPPALAVPAAALVVGLATDEWGLHRAPDSALVVAAVGSGHGLALVLGPQALDEVVRCDLRHALVDLGSAVGLWGSPRALGAPATALLRAAPRIGEA